LAIDEVVPAMTQIDFPNTPANGQIFTTPGGVSYQWIAARTLWANGPGTPSAPINSPTFTGDPQAPTPPAGDNDNSIATTAFVHASYLPLASTPSWPASFGSTPTEYVSVNHNGYPVAGKIPAGVLNQFSASMVVPSSYAQEPWPNTNYAAYVENDGSNGASSVNYFASAFLVNSNPSRQPLVENFNGVVSNTYASNGFAAAGLGHNFGEMVNIELDVNIWKVGTAAPTGEYEGIRLIGGGDGVAPTGGAFGVNFYPLTGYGTGVLTPWTGLLWSEDGAASTPESGSYFAHIGASGTGNGVHSQSVTMAARSSGGTNVAGHLRYTSGNGFNMTNGLSVSAAIAGSALDAGARLQTYDSANALVIPAVLRNDNGVSPTVALGFNVASSAAGDVSVSKGGIGFTRNAAQGGGYGSLYNRAATGTSPFTTADEVFRWTSVGVTAMGTLNRTGPDNTAACLFAGATKGIRFGFDTAGSYIEGVDNTGSASYQPLTLNGTTVFSVAPFLPATDNTATLGSASKRWSVVYAATSTINTSGRDAKTDIGDPTAAEKNVAKALKSMVRRFRYADAVEIKGDGARIHFGFVAEEVADAFRAEGLDPNQYGLYCEDTLEDGTIRRGLRYDELLCFILGAG
jgi:hypothetical protein